MSPTSNQGDGGPRRAFQLPTSSRRIDKELRDEMQFHIDERVEQFMADGMTREQATEEVQRRFGNYDQHREETRRIDQQVLRQRSRSEFLRTLASETRLAARALRRSPAFAIVSVITLALGVGATTAIFTVLDTVVLQPLAYRQSEQLVSILHPATVPGGGERRWGLSAGGYFWFRNNNQSFSNLAVYTTGRTTVIADGEAELVQTARVSASIFPVLRTRAMHGRLFTEDDDIPGASNVVVLSREYFERRFGSDTSIIGKTIETSGGSSEVIGVVEAGVTLPLPGPFSTNTDLRGFQTDLWLPQRLNPAGPFANSHPLFGIARLKPGVTLEGAQADLQRMFAEFPSVISTAYTEKFISDYNFRIHAAPLRDTVLGDTIPRTLWMLLGAVALVLMIAIANVANLFLVRLESRRQESAVRTALGASRTHMAAHYMAESVIVCTLAAAVGVGIAAAGLRAFLIIAPASIPRLGETALGARGITVAAAIAVIVGLILGVAPLMRRGVDITSLRESGRGLSQSVARRRMRNGLVVGQLALSLVLLAAAGLLFRSFQQLRDVKPGFDGTNVLAFNLILPFTTYDTREKARAFYRELHERIAAHPEVGAVAVTSSLPLEGFGTGCTVVWRENRPYDAGAEPPCIAGAIVMDGFFNTLRIPVTGRESNWRDLAIRTNGVVITRNLADRLWPGENPLGKGIGNNGETSTVWYQVIGVVDNLKAEALDRAPTEAIFYPATALREFDGQDGSLNSNAILVRTHVSNPMQLVPQLRTIVTAMDSRVPFIQPRLFDDVVKRSMARATFLMVLLGVASGVALVLSAVGIYGVVSYLVAQRRNEIGIRMALGASTTRVIGLVVLQSARLAIAGVALGTVAAMVAGKALSAMLYEVSPTDPVVLVAVGALLFLLVLVATFAPARRAARIDPAEAMRAT